MQKFEYRGPRFSVDLPAEFVTQGSTLAGRCTEISKEGMKLEVSEPLELNANGTITMSVLGRSLEFKVRIAHVEGTHGGLKFIYSTDAERQAVAHLVDSLAAPQNRPGPVLLKLQ